MLALLPEHGASLEHRFRSVDGSVEVHVLRFPSDAALDAYRADERRTAVLPQLERSGARTELHRLAPVDDAA